MFINRLYYFMSLDEDGLIRQYEDDLITSKHNSLVGLKKGGSDGRIPLMGDK